jgi:hypothetical protein
MLPRLPRKGTAGAGPCLDQYAVWRSSNYCCAKLICWNPPGTADCPKPGRSGAIHRCVPCILSMTSFHTAPESGIPCRKSIGVPSPESEKWILAPLTFTNISAPLYCAIKHTHGDSVTWLMMGYHGNLCRDQCDLCQQRAIDASSPSS